MRSAHVDIAKQMVDEAMRLVNSGDPGNISNIRVCKCAMSAAIQQVINDFKNNKPAGMVRFDFMVNHDRRSVLVNAGYIISSYKLAHV